MSFTQFKLHPEVQKGIIKAGYTDPTPIQEQSIPVILEDKDVMGLAQTGTGKTAAFALPILDLLADSKERGVLRALVIAPTRELALQIHEAFETLGSFTNLKSASIFGGVNINPQIRKLKAGIDIAVVCPGRFLDHMKQGNVKLHNLEVLVLDEADQMFDMGFFPTIRQILRKLPGNRQNLLFSATMPKEIMGLAKEILHEPVTVKVGNSAPPVTVSHALYPVGQHLKTALLLRLLNKSDTESVLVFTRTKYRAKRLGEQLAKQGYKAASLQGNLSQARRQDAMEGFRSGKYQILVATDIAARGIDVNDVSHVINYDIPSTPETYIHRIGRTGRAAKTGDAFTFVADEDKDMVRQIERTLKAAIERKRVDGFDYDIPAPKRDNEFARPPREPRNQRARQSSGGGSRHGSRNESHGRSRSGSDRDNNRNGSSSESRRPAAESRNGAGSRNDSGSRNGSANRNDSGSRNGSANRNDSGSRNGSANRNGSGSRNATGSSNRNSSNTRNSESFGNSEEGSGYFSEGGNRYSHDDSRSFAGGNSGNRSRNNGSGGSNRNSSAGGSRNSSAGGSRNSSAGGSRNSSAGGSRNNSAGGSRNSSAGGNRNSSGRAPARRR